MSKPATETREYYIEIEMFLIIFLSMQLLTYAFSVSIFFIYSYITLIFLDFFHLNRLFRFYPIPIYNQFYD